MRETELNTNDYLQMFLGGGQALAPAVVLASMGLSLLLSVLMVCGLRIPKARAAYIFGAVFILVIYGSVWFRL